MVYGYLAAYIILLIIWVVSLSSNIIDILCFFLNVQILKLLQWADASPQ